MASANKNLSKYNKSDIPTAEDMLFGIVVSEWNNDITEQLYKGAYDTLLKHGAKEENIITRYVPGSFELPLASQLLLENTDVDAVICIGCVIQGETRHFEFICNAVSLGIKDVSLKYNTPVVFGVLTTNNLQQAKDRSGGKLGNKGIEAAVSAIRMIDLGDSLIAGN
jgi:6,7-dimethyl-8-ribityllumazine synthase